METRRAIRLRKLQDLWRMRGKGVDAAIRGPDEGLCEGQSSPYELWRMLILKRLKFLDFSAISANLIAVEEI